MMASLNRPADLVESGLSSLDKIYYVPRIYHDQKGYLGIKPDIQMKIVQKNIISIITNSVNSLWGNLLIHFPICYA